MLEGRLTELHRVESSNFAAKGLHYKCCHCISDISWIVLVVACMELGLGVCNSPIDNLEETCQFDLRSPWDSGVPT